MERISYTKTHVTLNMLYVFVVLEWPQNFMIDFSYMGHAKTPRTWALATTISLAQR
jgi:hypothetical protein